MAKAKKILVALLSVVFAFSVISFLMATTVKADGEILIIKDGAEVRIALDDADRNGIRFTGYVSDSIELDEDTFAGIEIVREDNAVLNIKAENYLENTQKDGYKTFTAVIHNIPETAYGEVFTAKAYLVVDGGEPTYTNEVSRSIAQVASSELVDGADPLHVETLKGYVDPVAENATVSVNETILSGDKTFEVNDGDTLAISVSNNLAPVITLAENSTLKLENGVISAKESYTAMEDVTITLGSVSYVVTVKPYNANMLADFNDKNFTYIDFFGTDGLRKENGVHRPAYEPAVNYTADGADAGALKIWVSRASSTQTVVTVNFDKAFSITNAKANGQLGIYVDLYSVVKLDTYTNDRGTEDTTDDIVYNHLMARLGKDGAYNGVGLKMTTETAGWNTIYIPFSSFSASSDAENTKITFTLHKGYSQTATSEGDGATNTWAHHYLLIDEVGFYNRYSDPNVIAPFDNTNYEYISSWTGGFNKTEEKHNGYWPKVLGTTKDSTGGVLQLGTRANQSNLELWVKLYRSFKISESTATGIYFKVYTDYPLNAIESDFRVRLGSADRVYNGDSSYVHVSTTTTGAWTTIYVPFTSFTNIGADADVENTHLYLLLGKDWSNAGGNKVFYIDEIGFYNE